MDDERVGDAGEGSPASLEGLVFLPGRDYFPWLHSGYSLMARQITPV